MAEEIAPEDNVEVLRAGIDAYNRGDLSFVVERASDDIEVFAHHDLMNTGTYRGRVAFESWMQEWQEAWSEMIIEVRGVEALGDSHLLVDVYQRGVGAASGVPVEMEIIQLVEVRGGEIVRFHLYPDRETALRARATLETPE